MRTEHECEAYSVAFVPDDRTIRLAGVLRLNGAAEYAAIHGALSELAGLGGEVVVDLRRLQFLNSSGIAMLSRFVIDARDKGSTGLTILGSRSISWQTKSLINLQRLSPGLKLELTD